MRITGGNDMLFPSSASCNRQPVREAAARGAGASEPSAGFLLARLESRHGDALANAHHRRQ
ncbi:MAG: hypothetical protein ACREO8_01515 [Luteimonas sp.]